MKTFRTMAVAAIAALSVISVPASAQKMSSSSTALEEYLVPVSGATASPDADGFIRRWTLLEPISKPNRSNTVFVDSYIREAFATEYFKNQFTVVPKDGDKVKVEVEKQAPVNLGMGRPMMNAQPAEPVFEKQTLRWHSYDSKLFNVKLFRFATGLDKERYGAIFWGVTVVKAPKDMTVRLAAGSNSASMWWLNGEEVLIMSGDRRMVMDDCVSKRIQLKEGVNVLRVAVINGPGMSDFCARFIDEEGKPVRDLTISTSVK